MENEQNRLDPEQAVIERMKAADDFAGLGKKIQELFKLPQSLCKTRGDCCKIATFKGTLSYQDIQALADSDDPDAPNAREFLTCFIPYETQDEVRAMAPIFVERVIAQSGNDTTFFRCRFLGDSGRCLIHEDRPTGCRVYPFPHEKTIYHPGCGFEQKGLENARKIQDIQQFFERRLEELDNRLGERTTPPAGN